MKEEATSILYVLWPNSNPKFSAIPTSIPFTEERAYVWSLKRRDMSRHDLALAQESCRGHGTPSPLLTANI